MLLVALVVFVLGVQGDFTAENVFVCLSLFSAVDRTMSYAFGLSIAQGAECIISLERIQKFLLLEEKAEINHLDASRLRPNLSHCGIWMNKVKASWIKDGEATLKNITLTVKPGELLAVVGPVGCGKSSLLMSILGELPISSGELKVSGQVAYASQEPWVFCDSVKQNIVFGNTFDEARYREVISVCALNKDIEQFPHGDQTLVGERGVILSGGQKARVNLARAMYFDADIYLLDDPLSAVDASVSKHLFEKCICGYVKDKVRILATHQIQFLQKASQILVLKDGECLALGSYDELMNAGIDLCSLVNDSKKDHSQQTISEAINNSIAEDSSDNLKTESTTTFSSNSPEGDEGEDKCTAIKISEKAEEIKPPEEMKSSGAVKANVYKEYMKSGPGSFLSFIFVILYTITQAVFNGSDFWLTAWTNLEQFKYSIKDCWDGVNKTFLDEIGFYNDSYGIFDQNFFREIVGNVSDKCVTATRNYTKDIYDVEKEFKMEFYLSVYVGLVLTALLLTVIRSTALFHMCMMASIALHDKMFRNILRLPTAFFDRNPVGRILNRFSKDVGVVDEALPYAACDGLLYFFQTLGFISVTAIVEPYLLLPTALFGMLFMLIRNFYIPTLRDLKRYEGITHSPVFSHLSSSLYGLITIRAFKVQRTFEISFDHHQDQHTAVWFTVVAVIRWLGTALDWLCFAYSTSVIVAMVIQSQEPSNASMAGLAMVSALQLIGKVQICVRQSAEVESLMTSVERVVEYSTIETEAALESEQKKKPPPNWPFTGYIVYRNVSLKYTPNEPPVLNNISFEIYPEEKVGIVGRTGAGKSSIVATLFRMSEPEGEIKIDDICTKNIGLHDLRKKISIIPQDPVLFTGSIRRNLDPFREYSDNELWQALDEVCLKTFIQMSGGLDTKISEGGSNFSVGQRQLVCLARTILRKNKILILDEATANVDPKTDSVIQKTIRNRFAHCTVLTIAHRLNTIMDSDRVLVLDAGEMKEFDKPYDLLQDPNSIFSRMVQRTGPAMAKHLREVAHVAYIENTNSCGKFKTLGELNSNNIPEINCSDKVPRNFTISPDLGMKSSSVNEAFEREDTSITRL